MAMEVVLCVLMGIGLAAACGFRVFVPLLVVCLAARTGHLQLASGFQWLGSDAALVVLAVATVLEIGAYYLPWLDNLLDSAATPAAVVAGTIITASVATQLSPLFGWALAIVAGGGAAATVQGVTVVARAASTVTTGGLANPVMSSLEMIASLFLSVMAILVPLAAVALTVILLLMAFRKLRQHRIQRTPPPQQPATP